MTHFRALATNAGTLFVLIAAATFASCGQHCFAQDQLQLLPPPSRGAVPEVLPAPDSGPLPPADLPPLDDVPANLTPLPEELPIGPVWYNPGSWISFGEFSGWDGSFEFGLNGTEGNAESLSYRTGFDLTRSTERHDWKIDLNYAKSSANGVETQHNALLNSNWDWKFSQSRWSAFTRMQLEYDQFKRFDLRVALNTGLGYQWLDTGATKAKTRFGAGSSREIGGPADEWIPEAVLGFDFEHQISKRQKFETVVDYFPSWEDFTDYRLVTDASWRVALDEAANLSLKIGVIDRYDSTPNGARPNDIDYAILLLWKL